MRCKFLTLALVGTMSVVAQPGTALSEEIYGPPPAEEEAVDPCDEKFVGPLSDEQLEACLAAELLRARIELRRLKGELIDAEMRVRQLERLLGLRPSDTVF